MFKKIHSVLDWKLWIEIITRNIFWLSWCIKDVWGTKVIYFYVVKWQVFHLQRGKITFGSIYSRYPCPGIQESIFYGTNMIFFLSFSCRMGWMHSIWHLKKAMLQWLKSFWLGEPKLTQLQRKATQPFILPH